jgi:hypothetical protein
LRILKLPLIDVAGDQVACDFEHAARTEERLQMQAPACLHIVQRLPPIDAVIAEEAVSKFTDCDPLVRRSDE